MSLTWLAQTAFTCAATVPASSVVPSVIEPIEAAGGGFANDPLLPRCYGRYSTACMAVMSGADGAMRTDMDKTVVWRRARSGFGRGSLRSFTWPAAAALIVAACANGDDGEADAGPADDQVDDGVADEGTLELVDPYDVHTSEVYGDTTRWICHPDLADDACDDLRAMVLAPDGSTEPADLAAATDPGVDCFYVYPTVSAHPDTNSTLEPGNEEISTVEAQAAPFAASCRDSRPCTARSPWQDSPGEGSTTRRQGSLPMATWRMHGAPMSPSTTRGAVSC